MINSFDDAIEHFEGIAKRLRVDDSDGCAVDFRQVAEWLRELKAYRDGCHCDTCKYLDKNSKNRPCGWCGDNESNWEYGGKR